MCELLAKRGLPTDEDHAGIHDTSALLAIEMTPGLAEAKRVKDIRSLQGRNGASMTI
jgi:hypothetical protein